MTRRALCLYWHRRLRGLLYDEVWHAHVLAPTGEDSVIHVPGLTAKRSFTADPFLVSASGKLYVFYETLTPSGKGVLGCHVFDGREWLSEGVVLEEPWHLSYPQVFKYEGHVYMIPESSAADGVFLYDATEFPRRWAPVCKLLQGRYVDSTLVLGATSCYLFACNTEKRLRLELWMAPRPTGPWILHPQGRCLSASCRLSRPGGRVYAADGRLWRVAQDCHGDYGKRLFRIPIETLDSSTYREGRAELLMVPHRCERGRHTFNSVRYNGEMWYTYDTKVFVLKTPWALVVSMSMFLGSFLSKIFQRRR